MSLEIDYFDLDEEPSEGGQCDSCHSEKAGEPIYTRGVNPEYPGEMDVYCKPCASAEAKSKNDFYDSFAKWADENLDENGKVKKS